jgi:predicted phosphodiesterase
MLLISDLHKSLDSVDEMNSVKWLLDVLDELKPDYLIGAGDWGEAMTADDFSEILARARLITVYGNHENFAIIKSLSIRDGQVVRVGGLRVSGINGLIGHDKDYGIPPGRFMRVVNKIKGVDVLVTHQPPYIPELYPNMRDDEPAMLMAQALERIRPRLHFSRHMTGGCYSYYEFKWGKYLRVDSSARFRCYALTDGRDVAVYRKGEEVFRFSL